MKKVAGTVAVVFALGAGATVMLGGLLGTAAEATGVGLVGAALVGTSYLLGGKLGQKASSPAPQARTMGQTRAA